MAGSSGAAAAVSGQTLAPPMAMLSPFMSDYKAAGQTAAAEGLSLGGYIELMTLVRWKI